MLDIFHPNDGDFQQAALFWCGVPVIRLVVEKLALTEAGQSGWDWTIWPIYGTWSCAEDDWYGTERNPERAQLAALDAAIPLLAMLSLNDDDSATDSEALSIVAPTAHDYSDAMVH